jgi:predicted nucleotide-binding protein
LIAVTLSLTLMIEVSLVRSQGWNSTKRVVVDEVVDALAAVDEARDDAAAMHMLQAVGNRASLGQINDAVREQLGVDAEVLLVRQAAQHGVRDGADPGLKRGAVLDEGRDIGADGLFLR